MHLSFTLCEQKPQLTYTCVPTYKYISDGSSTVYGSVLSHFELEIDNLCCFDLFGIFPWSGPVVIHAASQSRFFFPFT